MGNVYSTGLKQDEKDNSKKSSSLKNAENTRKSEGDSVTLRANKNVELESCDNSRRRIDRNGCAISLEDSRFYVDMEESIHFKQANKYPAGKSLRSNSSYWDCEPHQWTNFVGGYLNTLSRHQKPSSFHFCTTPQLSRSVISAKSALPLKNSTPSSCPTPAPLPIKRRNSTNSVGLCMSIDEMDVSGMIYVTSLVLHHHISEGCMESREVRRGYGIFDDSHLAYPKHAIPAASDCPQHVDVYKFYQYVYVTAQMEKDCIIMSLVYIERMLSEAAPALCICRSNWKSIILSGMALASKVWDDLSMLNVDFSNIGNINLHHLNILEVAALFILQFSVRVDSSTFARYYFRLRHWCMIVGAYKYPVLESNMKVTQESTLHNKRRMERNSLFLIASHGKETYNKECRHTIEFCDPYAKLPPCLEELVGETLTESGGRRFGPANRDLKRHEEEANFAKVLKHMRSESFIAEQQHLQGQDYLSAKLKLILIAIGDPRAEYDIGRVLGVGMSGLVQVARHKTTKVEYAMKTVNFNRAKGYLKINELKNELEIMITLNHPNIVRVFEIYESPERDQLYVIMELCEGGDLQERLDRVGRFSEREAAVLLRKMICAVRHCHQSGICHRNLCLRHWCFESAGDGAELKLIDFGQSRHFYRGEVMHLPVGSPLTVAPEVLAGEYTCSCDLWSLGVTTFTLLAGHHPFTGNGDFEILEKVKKGQWKWPKELLITAEASDFVSRLLSHRPERRMTTDEALSHSWLTTHAGKPSWNTSTSTSVPDALSMDGCACNNRGSFVSPPPSPLIVESIKQYERAGLLKRLVLHMVSLSMGAKTKALLRSEFEKLDTEGNGFISSTAFSNAVKASGLTQDRDELEELVAGLEGEGGCLRYNDFLAAGSVCVDSGEILDDAVLRAVFEKFDKRHDGNIACEDLGEFLGCELTPAETKRMMSEAGLKAESFLSYDSFVKVVREQVGALSSIE